MDPKKALMNDTWSFGFIVFCLLLRMLWDQRKMLWEQRKMMEALRRSGGCSQSHSNGLNDNEYYGRRNQIKLPKPINAYGSSLRNLQPTGFWAY